MHIKMKSKNLHLIITLILGVLTTYFIIDSIRTTQRDKAAKEHIKQSEQRVRYIEDVNDSLRVVVRKINLKSEKDSLDLVSLKNENKIIEDAVRSTKRAYSELLKQVPKNTRDSLANYKQREQVLLTENRNLDDSNVNLRKQVKTLEVINVDLKEIIVNKDLITQNDEKIKKEMGKTINDLQVRLKESRKGKVKHWLEGGVVGILIAVLLL